MKFKMTKDKICEVVEMGMCSFYEAKDYQKIEIISLFLMEKDLYGIDLIIDIDREVANILSILIDPASLDELEDARLDLAKGIFSNNRDDIDNLFEFAIKEYEFNLLYKLNEEQ